jgi:simple sugar transport system ATP-binding protein
LTHGDGVPPNVPGTAPLGPSPGAFGNGSRALEIRNVTKRFGAVAACEDVSLTVEPGEIRGLLGQNGAGKSTLMKIVAGLVQPDAGMVVVNDRPLPPGEPHAASEAGIGMVHQHFSLVGPLAVWENVTLGDRGSLDERRAVERVRELGERYGLQIDPYARIHDLAPGERQRVEIIKCLRRDPTLIVLDEPTSVLTQNESERLFEVLMELVRSEGRAVVLISHRLEEVLQVTDRITVLREGSLVTTVEKAGATVDMLASEMLGRPVSLRREAAAIGLTTAKAREWQASDDEVETEAVTPDAVPALEIDGAVTLAPDGHTVLDSLSLRVQPGEILGIAGVEGNGQTELVDLLAGLVTPRAGAVRIDGKPVRMGRGRASDAVGVVPADRHRAGCVLELSVAENLILDRPSSVARFGVIRKRLLAQRASALVADFGIATPSVDTPVWALSGGNQQRVVLARELSQRPRVLVVSQPTQGLDVGAMEDIWDRLRRAAGDDSAVLLVSTDLDEILAVSDRIAVIYRGRIVGEMGRHEYSHERLGLLMGGAVR